MSIRYIAGVSVWEYREFCTLSLISHLGRVVVGLHVNAAAIYDICGSSIDSYFVSISFYCVILVRIWVYGRIYGYYGASCGSHHLSRLQTPSARFLSHLSRSLDHQHTKCPTPDHQVASVQTTARSEIHGTGIKQECTSGPLHKNWHNQQSFFAWTSCEKSQTSLVRAKSSPDRDV